MIVIAGTVRLHADKRPHALKAAADMSRRSMAEPGCEAYRFAVDIEDDHVIHLFEQWADEESLQAHFTAPHFATFSAAIAEAVDRDATFTRYEVSSAGPLFG